jgi:type VI secretion system secreted protein VgrG
MANLRKTLVKTPLGDDVRLLRMEGEEALSRPFLFEAELLSERTTIEPSALLGKPIGIQLELPEGDVRYFHGHVAALRALGGYGRYQRHGVTLRPWLWLLTRASNCRVFQRMTVPQIVKQVCSKHGFTDVKLALTASYPQCEYRVQYRETDFAFVSRLLEQEGIYYYFRHEKDQHTLVLADGPAAHTPWPGFETVKYAGTAHDGREISVIDQWGASHEVQAGAYALDDYDFERPTTELKVRLNQPKPHAENKLELYDYPGGYLETGTGNRYAAVRLEEQHASYDRTTGSGNARGLAAGFTFTLSKHPLAKENQRHLVVEARHRIELDDYESHHGAHRGEPYRCDFVAIKSKTQFRPPRTTPRPVLAGVQSATVVGRAGEEFHTDKYGRVRVQFPWDREGKNDENSSCFIRVAQAWAGKGWGTIHVPRVGHEVLVSFLEGDPDQPVITGSVYNGKNAPPFKLSKDAVISGIKTNTVKGVGYNQLTFDDTKGAEEIVIHAQRDLNAEIENDCKFDAKQHILLTAGTELRLKVGSSEIVLTKRGIELKGMTIRVEANGVLTLRGATIVQN